MNKIAETTEKKRTVRSLLKALLQVSRLHDYSMRLFRDLQKGNNLDVSKAVEQLLIVKDFEKERLLIIETAKIRCLEQTRAAYEHAMLELEGTRFAKALADVDLNHPSSLTSIIEFLLKNTEDGFGT